MSVWSRYESSFKSHHYMFWPGDLEYHTKNAFFNGLRPEYQAMVIHKRDDPQTSITDLLIAMRECEENEAQHCRSRRAEYTKAYPPIYEQASVQN